MAKALVTLAAEEEKDEPAEPSGDDLDELPDAEPGAAFDSATEAAIQAIRKKGVLSAEEFYALEERARLKAFTVSDVADLDVVSDVWRAIESAVANGETLEDFKERVGGLLEEAWGEEDPARLETIFRTNVQSAYSAGRWYQNSRPEVRATHPYSKFVAVLDDRTSHICGPKEEGGLHGTVLRADDAFWASHQPPLHHQCRSDIVPLTEEEAKEEGIDEEAPDAEPDDGFGTPAEDFEPDLSSRPPELVNLYELKLTGYGQ
jgi:SPP1 gp7 family putative phage head morphogenesis protein